MMCARRRIGHMYRRRRRIGHIRRGVRLGGESKAENKG
jgi:hypothetical protein